MSDTPQTPQSTPVTSARTEDLRVRLGALQDLSDAERHNGGDSGDIDDQIKALKVALAKSHLDDYNAAIGQTRIDIVKSYKELDEAQRAVEGAPAAAEHTVASDFRKGVLKNMKVLPGFHDIGQFITDGAGMSEIGGGLVPIIAAKAIEAAAHAVTTGVQTDAQAEAGADAIAAGLSQTQGDEYPPSSDKADDAGREAYGRLRDKAEELGVPPNLLIGYYKSSQQALADANITDIKDQVDVIGMLTQILRGTRKNPADVPGDFQSILKGSGASTFLGDDMAGSGYSDSDLQNAIAEGQLPAFLGNAAPDSLEKGRKMANEVSSLQTSVGSGVEDVEGNAMKDWIPLCKSVLQRAKKAVKWVKKAQENANDMYTVPVDKSVSDAEYIETEGRKRSYSKISAFSKDAQNALAGAEAVDQTEAPAFLDDYQTQSKLQLESQMARLNKEEQDQLGGVQDDPDRQAEISAIFARRRAKLTGDVEADGYDIRKQVDTLRMLAWEDAVTKQKKVVEAAEAEARRAHEAAGIDAGKAAQEPAGLRETLTARRAVLEKAVTGGDDADAAARGEGYLPLYSGDEIKTKRAGINDIDQQIARLNLIDAAANADQKAKAEQRKYEKVSQQALQARDLINKDKSDADEGAATASMAEGTDEEKADYTIKAVRSKRDKAFVSQIKEAELRHDGQKADQLRATRQWWLKYDQELDSGTPEWEAKQQADQGSSNGGAPVRGTISGNSVASRGGNIGESLAAAGAAYQGRGPVQDVSQLLASSQKIEAAINNLTAKWASTRFNVVATYA